MSDEQDAGLSDGRGARELRVSGAPGVVDSSHVDFSSSLHACMYEAGGHRPL